MAAGAYLSPMRIISGRWAGRHLESPGKRVRPTSEPVRDAALGWVEEELEGASVLDLFAGTGALGLEALSRGAARADFVERNPAALHALKANVAKFRLKGSARVFKRDALEFLEGVEEGGYDLALVDPPYTSSLAARVVEAWTARPFSRLLLVETSRETTLPGRNRRKVIDDSALTLYRARPRRPGRERNPRPAAPRTPGRSPRRRPSA